MKKFIFSFGIGHAFCGRYVELVGTEKSTREEMFRLFGDKWSFQYPEEMIEDLIERHEWLKLPVNSDMSTLQIIEGEKKDLSSSLAISEEDNEKIVYV